MVNGHIFGETGDICMLDSRIVKIVEVIEDCNCVPGREQAFNEMGTDETRSPSDQNSHGASVDLQLVMPNTNWLDDGQKQLSGCRER